MEAPASLLADFLEWVDARPRAYAEVMDAWRTSCPRLPVWEDAVDLGFVSRVAADPGEPSVVVTPTGIAWLASERQPAPQSAA
ncbi:MAG: hypothetical protein AB7T37_18850 [Dehalococcoidia bacterium]